MEVLPIQPDSFSHREGVEGLPSVASISEAQNILLGCPYGFLGAFS
jgi:hypothetical protein